MKLQMSETPLHKAAANNHTEVMRFLLDWKGEEKPELESKNMVIFSAIRIITRKYGNLNAMLWRRSRHHLIDFLQYGETPLHLAAKNGCTEAVKLLLEHNAFEEAKTSVSISLAQSWNCMCKDYHLGFDRTFSFSRFEAVPFSKFNHFSSLNPV